jgi:GNAT superfamily N-acetyltransferase
MNPTSWKSDAKYETGQEARDGWPTTPGRDAALVRTPLLTAGLPVTVRIRQGVDVMLNPGRPQDRAAVAALHHRCSPRTLLCRYHGINKQLSEYWLAQLTAPEQGVCLLAWRGHDVVAIAQLLPAPQPARAELGILVEDAWQQRGLGTALLATLVGLAMATEIQTIEAHCLPGQAAVVRTAHNAGVDRIDRIDTETVHLQLPHPA